MTTNIETTMTTEELLEQRHQVYGDRVPNMENVALMWTGYLRSQNATVEIRPEDVSTMFQLAKIYRFGVEPEYSDNIDDMEGYGQMTREVVGERLIKARTVDEFLAKREARGNAVSVSADDDAARMDTERRLRAMNREAAERTMAAERVRDGETPEDRLERQHEERAYGQSMGRGE